MKKRKIILKDHIGAMFGLVIFGVIVLLIAIIPIINGMENLKGKDGAITVNLSMSGFSPKKIVVNAGEPFDVYLVNQDNEHHTDGGGWHQFASDEAGFDYKIAPLAKETVTIVINQPGFYFFYCDVCCGGKENPTMQGILEVV